MTFVIAARNYYPDLTNNYFTSGLALVHSRFSTNTFPVHGDWHNLSPSGTQWWNQWFAATAGGWKLAKVYSPLPLSGISKIRPDYTAGHGVIAPSLDNVLEFFGNVGLSLPHQWQCLCRSLSMRRTLSVKIWSPFYEYHSILMEPWDGPAALLFSDGRFAGGSARP